MRMCALLVGLPDVVVAGVGEWPSWLRIVIATAAALSGSPTCCGVAAHRHGVREVELVDLPVFGRPARLVWRKQRWGCATCRRTWTDQDPQIASARCAITTRAARWTTMQVGRHGPSVAEVATDLQCDWHTVMDAVALYGTPLIDDPDRFCAVTAVGLDETLFAALVRSADSCGRFRSSTSPPASCSTSSLVGIARRRALGSPPAPRRGGPGSGGRGSIWRRRIGRCSTRCEGDPSSGGLLGSWSWCVRW